MKTMTQLLTDTNAIIAAISALTPAEIANLPDGEIDAAAKLSSLLSLGRDISSALFDAKLRLDDKRNGFAYIDGWFLRHSLPDATGQWRPSFEIARNFDGNGDPVYAPFASDAATTLEALTACPQPAGADPMSADTVASIVDWVRGVEARLAPAAH